MPNTWETLFHLTSFMKYLFHEALPEEEISCPRHTVDSLFDLLSVTLECINIVRGKNSFDKSFLQKKVYKMTEELVNETLANDRRNKTISPSIEQENAQNDSNIRQECKTLSKNSNFVHDQEMLLEEERMKHIAPDTQSIIINKKLSFLNKDVLSDKNRYICLLCDKYFYNSSDWYDHLMYDFNHNSCGITSCEEIFCSQCDFHVYGQIDITNVCLDYHKKCHAPCSTSNINKKGGKTVSISEKYANNGFRNNKVPNNQRSSETTKILSSENKEFGKLTTKHNEGKQSSYYICENFQHLNEDIHNKQITEAFYCRPCNKACLKSKRSLHCESGRHKNLIANKNFKNKEATCRYCNLVLIGPPKVLEEYMKYHTTAHGKEVSYDLKPILLDPQKSPQKIDHPGKIESHFSYECENIDRDEKNKQPLNQISEQIQTNYPSVQDNTNQGLDTSKVMTEKKDWYCLSKNEEIMNKLKELQLIRKKEKTSGKSPRFGGFCVVCNEVVEDAFDWMDHINLDGHQAQGNEEIVFPELNLYIFGNKSLIKNFVP